MERDGPVAQRSERAAHNGLVAGSIPARPIPPSDPRHHIPPVSKRHEKRLARRADEAAGASPPEPGSTCVLCRRPIPPGAKSSRHHLVPRLKGGARGPIVRLHQICHSAVHARFTEAELARRLSEPDALRAEPRMAEFLDWVAGKPPDFHAPTRAAKSRAAKWR